MTILFIINANDYGGARTAIVSLLAQLRHLDKITLLAIDQGPVIDTLTQMGLKVFQTSTRSFRRDLKQIIRSEKIELIHTHGAKINILTKWLGDTMGVPVMTTLHSDYRYDYNNAPLKKKLLTPLNKLALKRMAMIVTMSKVSKGHMLACGFKEERLSVIYNGIEDHTPTEPMYTRQACLDRFGLATDSHLFYVGIMIRFHPIKAIEMFIEAANALQTLMPNVHFLLGGDGEESYYQSIKAMANGTNTHFLGNIQPEDKSYFYQLIDCNTLTSDSEGLPYVLLEGGLYGKGTVATAVGGIPELIKDGVNGLLVAKRDVEGFKEALIRLAGHKELNQQYGSALRQTILSQFTSQFMAQQYHQMYEKVINKE